MNWQERIIQFAKGDTNLVFLVNLTKNTKELADFLKGFSGNASVIFFNLEVPKEFLEIKLSMTTSEEYLSKEDYEEIDRYVFKGLSCSWYLYQDITEYRGIQLGKMFEYDFQKYLIPRIKILEVILKVIDKENIKKIVTIEDTDELGAVARLYAAKRSIPILEISLAHKKNTFWLELSARLKGRFSLFLDALALRRLIKDKNQGKIVLADNRLSQMLLKFNDKDLSFMPCVFEKGIVLRLNLLKQRIIYLPLYFEMSPYGDTYSKKWEALKLDEDFKQVFKYKGISIWEIVRDKLYTFFIEYAPRISGNIGLLEKLLAVKKIKVAVLRNDLKEMEKTVILALRLFGVPSLVIQHGILAEGNHNVLLADRFVAWGRGSLDWYRRYGNPEEKLLVMGNPRFDRLINWRPKISKEELCRRFNLDVNKGIILFATQQINKFSSFWTDDLFRVMADSVLSATREFSDMQLVIKVDPYEDIAPYQALVSLNSKPKAAAVRDFDIYTLIYFSDLVITQDSTVALEAMVFDKPIVTFNLTKREDRVPYAEKGAALGIHKSEDLLPAIKKTLADPQVILRLKKGRAEFIREYACGLDAKAGARISDILKGYLNN